jgi:hypothetical protein
VSDKILIDGDLANFMPTFSPAIVVVQPGQMKASGKATINGKKICVDGDEADLKVPGCQYMTPQYSIPGVGTLKIDRLASDQKAQHSMTGGKLVLLKGGNFTAKFEVQSPAQQPAPPGPPVPDATPSYTGQGSFMPANQTVNAT